MKTSPSYSSKSDLQNYAQEIELLTDKQKIDLTAYIVAAGLMYPRGFQAKLIWSMAKLGARLHGSTPQRRYAMTLHRASVGPEFARDTIKQTCEWMIHGKDRTDIRSAGGFNADELNSIVKAVDILKSNKIPVV